MSKEINCQNHGDRVPVIVCKHLIKGSDLGFAYLKAIIEQEDDYDTVMCEDCESILLEDQEWSDRLYDSAGFSYICSVCVKSLLMRHQLVAEGDLRYK